MRWALSFHRSFGLPVTIVRPFNAYGPRQSARAVIPTIITQAVAGRRCKLGTLDTTRDFTFVEDTARGFVADRRRRCGARRSRERRLGQGGQHPRHRRGRSARSSARELVVEGDEQRMRPAKSEVSRLLADSSKARTPGRLARRRSSLDDGLRRTVDWIREHIDLYRPKEYAV